MTTDLLDGQVAIVTGAAQGLGLAIARGLLEHGARVVIADISGDALTAAADELGAPDHVLAIPADVMVAADWAKLVERAREHFGRLDILVNNAGVLRDAFIGKMREEDFDAVMGVSLKGSWLGTKAVSALFREQKRGTIINMSSLSGKIGNPAQTNYSAAKAALVGLTKASAKELGPMNVRVNCVMPGLIRTAMTLSMKPEFYDAKQREVPMQRAGEPHEVAGVVVFLASALASYVNGAVIEVAGGRGI